MKTILPVLILLSLAWTTTALGLTVPLSIENSRAEDARVQEPVTSGIPLPEDAGISDVSALAILNAQGQVVPAQFTVLARWKGLVSDTSKPIKWTLVDFQADVPAGAGAAYTLSTAGQNIPPPAPVTIQENRNDYLVNTGPATFRISKKHFNLFDEVKLTSPAGSLPTILVSQAGRGGIELRDAQGRLYTSLFQAPELITIEEAGPMRAVVRVRGVLKNADGSFFAPSVNRSRAYPRFSQPYAHSFVFYDCRIHFYAGKSYVRVMLTLENNGSNGRTNPEQRFAPIQAVLFDSLELVLNLNEFDNPAAFTHDAQATLQANDSLTLSQNWRENLEDQVPGTLEPLFAKGIYYQTKHSGQLLSTGSTSPGWLQLQTPDSRSIGLAMRHFWQNFPKKLTASPDQLRIGLWPEEGYYPYCRSEDFPEPEFDLYCRRAGRNAGVYLFDAGRHKTHEFILDFSMDTDVARMRSLSAEVESPLMALAEPAWYAESKALGLIAPAGMRHPDQELDEALQRFERHLRAIVNVRYADNEWSIHTLKTANPPHWAYSMQHRYFGWMNFGDLLWSNQIPSALHYDWPWSMLLHYLRTGERYFFDTGLEMARHRYDIDQYHGERMDSRDDHKWINHMAFYETDKHADPSIGRNNPARVSMHSHTWNGGLVLYYLLTGDRRAWGAALANGRAALNHFGREGLSDARRPRCAGAEIRHETWAILNLVNLYRVSGDPELLRVARDIAVNMVLYREQQAGGLGLFGEGNCPNLDNTRQSSVMYAYALEPLIQIHHETQEPQLGELILRMADFMKGPYLFGGDFNAAGLYRPLQSLYEWKANDPEGIAGNEGGEPVRGTFNADLFAYAYLLSGRPEYLDWARRSFRDAIFYYTSGGSRYLDPNSRSRLSFIDGMFSGSQTKVHGWLARTNQVYLHVEWLGQQRRKAE